MKTYGVSLAKYKVDYLLSLTAMLQPVLTLIQLYMADAMHVEPDIANRFRVMSTAVPIVLAMIFVMMRKPLLTIATYGIVILILLLTLMNYPDRWVYMSDEFMKFTLPVVIPTGLCIASVKNFAVLIRCMLFVSLSAAFIGLLYAGAYLSGSFEVDSYNIGFSYALLFPTFVLISKKNVIWNAFAVFMMIEMLAIGSRGALLLSIIYWIFTLLWNKNTPIKLFFYIILIVILISIFLDPIVNLLADLFDTIGINSRTLRLFTDDELLTHDSGRFELQEKVWEIIQTRPILGHGVWADRAYFGVYCHNVLLELLLNFGFLGSTFLLGILLVKQIRIFKKLPLNHKTMYIMMFGLVLPLFVSSSYLTSFNVGMFLGFTYLQSSLYNKKQYLEYQYK